MHNVEGLVKIKFVSRLSRNYHCLDIIFKESLEIQKCVLGKERWSVQSLRTEHEAFSALFYF